MYFSKTKKIVVIFILLLYSMTVTYSGVHDYEIEQGKLNYVNNELENKKIKINNITVTLKETMEELRLIDEMVASLYDDIDQIEGDIKDSESKVEEIKIQNKDSANKLENIRFKFNEYKNQLMGAEINNLWEVSPNTMKYKIRLMKITLETENSIVSVINNEKKILDNNQSMVNKELNELEEIKDRLIVKQNLVASKQNEKTELVKLLNKEKSGYEYIYQSLAKESDIIKNRLVNLEKDYYTSNLRYSNGVLGYPTSKSGSYITSRFGKRNQPKAGASTNHTAIDIGGVGYGAPVIASEAGRVITSGNQGSYGKVVIVDHGNSISTVYAHNSRLKVSEGDVVQRGQLIALTGSTGVSTGPHIHFEVRVNGVPEDPERWLE